jgi:uncharacterized protein (DUF488 family)
MITKQKKSLFKRQKLLLALLQSFGGRLSNIDLQKYLFLYTETCENEKSYEFVPYKYGCFSFQSYADRRRFKEVGAILGDDDWHLVDGEDYISQVSKEEQKKLTLFSNKYKKLKGDKLVRHIYDNYPYYAINSEIASRIMDEDGLTAIKKARPSKRKPVFYTIGYEGQSFENYLNRLLLNNISVLCDVRKNPLSRKYGFSKSTLSETLNKLGIEYIHMPELGIISDKRQELKTQKDYDRLFDDYEATTLAQNNEALDALEVVMKKHKRVAITCFEATHCMCHRGRVAKALAERPSWEYDIVHI